MSFFMRRWKDGTYGSVYMGVYHGIYCLGGAGRISSHGGPWLDEIYFGWVYLLE